MRLLARFDSGCSQGIATQRPHKISVTLHFPFESKEGIVLAESPTCLSMHKIWKKSRIRLSLPEL